METATVSADEFQALEQKVLRAVELIRSEREARAAAEADATNTRAELDAVRGEMDDLREKLAAASAAQGEVEHLQRERNDVRQRVEKMLAQMDELL